MGASGEEVLNVRLKPDAGWSRWISARAIPGIRRAVVVLVVLGVIAGLLPWGARGLGQWLVVADQLEPARAIVVLSGGVWNTADEVRLVARELGAESADRVILVTSKTHSRRVRATWAAVVGPPSRAIVRYARDEPFDTEQWWRHTRDALQVSSEVFGLMNVWAGFPLQPDRQRR